MPETPMLMNMQIDAELGGNRDQVVRIVISDRADGATRGQPTRTLIGDMASAGYKAFRKGVMEYAINTENAGRLWTLSEELIAAGKTAG